MGLQKVHYLDLKHKAVRGPLRDDHLYVLCHDVKPDPYIPDHRGYRAAYPVLTEGHVAWVTPHTTWKYITDDESWNLAFHGTNKRGDHQWYYAADFGLWDLPGISYRNKSNYVLDVEALLREDRVWVEGVSW